jgi:GAF domain-containing protein
MAKASSIGSDRQYSLWLNGKLETCEMDPTSLAAKAGISSAYISMLRKGRRRPSFQVVKALAQALDAEGELDVALAAAGLGSGKAGVSALSFAERSRLLIFDIASLSSRRAAKEALCSILDRLAAAITFDYGNISRVDWESREIDVLAHKIPANPALLGKPSFVRTPWPVSDGITGFAATSGTTARVSDVRKSLNYREHWKPTRSELAVPLILEGRAIGVLNLESSRLGHFTRQDEQLLDAVVATIATSVVRAKDYYQLEELQRQLQGLWLLHQTNLEKKNETTLLQELAFKVVGFFGGFDLCVIRINDPERGFLLLRAVAHRHVMRTRPDQVGLRLLLNESISGQAVERRQAISRRDVMSDPDFRQKELATRLGLRGMVAAPIPAPDVLEPPLGCISVYCTSMDHRFQVAHERLLEHIARFVSMALTNLRNSLRLEAIVDTAELCHLGARSRSNLDDVCALICKKTGAKAASIFLFDGDVLRLGGTTGLVGITDYSSVSYKLGEGKTGWVGLYGRPMRLIRDSDEELSSFEGAEEVFKFVENIPMKGLKQGFLAVPIKIKNSVVGVIRAAVGREDNLDFTPFDESILQQIAIQLGLTLEAEASRPVLFESARGTSRSLSNRR